MKEDIPSFWCVLLAFGIFFTFVLYVHPETMHGEGPPLPLEGHLAALMDVDSGMGGMGGIGRTTQ